MKLKLFVLVVFTLMYSSCPNNWDWLTDDILGEYLYYTRNNSDKRLLRGEMEEKNSEGDDYFFSIGFKKNDLGQNEHFYCRLTMFEKINIIKGKKIEETISSHTYFPEQYADGEIESITEGEYEIIQFKSIGVAQGIIFFDLPAFGFKKNSKKTFSFW